MWPVGFHFGSKKTWKLSIVFEDLSRYSVFFSNRSEALIIIYSIYSTSDLVSPRPLPTLVLTWVALVLFFFLLLFRVCFCCCLEFLPVFFFFSFLVLFHQFSILSPPPPAGPPAAVSIIMASFPLSAADLPSSIFTRAWWGRGYKDIIFIII